MKAAYLIAAALSLLLIGGLKSLARDAADKEQGKAAQANVAAREQATKAMLAAAEKTLEATKAGYDTGTSPLGELFVWSRLVLDAELKLAKTQSAREAALLEHWQRMKQTNAKVGALHRAGSKGGENEYYFATRYYLAEAERWLADAGLVPPKHVNSSSWARP